MKYETELIEQAIKDGSKILHSLSIIERQEVQINDLVSLTLWMARRLPKTYVDFAYTELVSIVGKNHKHLDFVKDEIQHLLNSQEEN